MDEERFKRLVCYAQAMYDIGDQHDYWAGYRRGLRRAYHGEQFGTDDEHELWSSMSTSNDMRDHERGRGYLDGLAAG